MARKDNKQNPEVILNACHHAYHYESIIHPDQDGYITLCILLDRLERAELILFLLD